MNCSTSLLVAALLAAFTLSNQLHGQSANVKTPNKNQSAKFKSVIVKGSGNLIQSNAMASFIGGGQSNVITTNATNAVIGGGFGNAVGTNVATVGGGEKNTNNGYASTIGGGQKNTALDELSTVGGGFQNSASGTSSTVSGGQGNTASGSFSTVAGGLGNTASGDSSFAAGRRAAANHDGCFVWADATDAAFQSADSNQFLVRANFVGINRSTPVDPFEVFGVQAPQTNDYGGMYVRTSGRAAKPFYGYLVAEGAIGGFAWTYVDGSDGNKWKLNVNDGDRVTVTTAGRVGIGTNAPSHPLQMASGAHVTAAGVWTDVSDEASKENFRPVDSREVLAKVAALPVTKWNHRAEPGVDRIGPTAQDFHAAFGLGAGDKHISTLDAGGVALAAVKGLIEELQERDAEIEGLKLELREIRERLSNLPPQ